jgi:hypothetical protein
LHEVHARTSTRTGPRSPVPRRFGSLESERWGISLAGQARVQSCRHRFCDAMLPDGSRLHVVIPDITRAHWSVKTDLQSVASVLRCLWRRRGVTRCPVGGLPTSVPSRTSVRGCVKERSTAVGVKPRSALRLVQPVQTIVPVTVPVSVASGKLTGLPEMVQVTGPGAADFEATLVKVPNGEVKVRSKLTGTNRAR